MKRDLSSLLNVVIYVRLLISHSELVSIQIQVAISIRSDDLTSSDRVAIDTCEAVCSYKVSPAGIIHRRKNSHLEVVVIRIGCRLKLKLFLG